MILTGSIRSAVQAHDGESLIQALAQQAAHKRPLSYDKGLWPYLGDALAGRDSKSLKLLSSLTEFVSGWADTLPGEIIWRDALENTKWPKRVSVPKNKSAYDALLWEIYSDDGATAAVKHYYSLACKRADVIGVLAGAILLSDLAYSATLEAMDPTSAMKNLDLLGSKTSYAAWIKRLQREIQQAEAA